MISLKLAEEKEHRTKIEDCTTSFQKGRIKMRLPVPPLSGFTEILRYHKRRWASTQELQYICNELATGYMIIHCAVVISIKLGGFLQSSSATHFKTYPIYYVFQPARHKECSWLMNSLTKLVNFINRA